MTSPLQKVSTSCLTCNMSSIQAQRTHSQMRWSWASKSKPISDGGRAAGPASPVQTPHDLMHEDNSTTGLAPAAAEMKPRDDIWFLHRAALVIFLVCLTLAAWYLREFLLLIFSAIVTGIFIRSLSEPLERRFAMHHWIALGSVLLALSAAL